jgi:hypothetical protein
MALVIIQAIDPDIPTIAKYRAMLSTAIMRAQAFLAANPTAQKCVEDFDKLHEYNLAKGILYDATQSPGSHDSEVTTKAAIAILEYERSPLSTVDILNAKAFSGTYAENSQKYELYKYSKKIIDVEGMKSDAEIQAHINAVEKGCHRRNDILEVLEDGTDCGRMVVWPDYLIIQIEGKAKEFQHLKQPIVGENGLDIIAMSKYSFDIDRNMTEKELRDIAASSDTLIIQKSIDMISDKSKT